MTTETALSLCREALQAVNVEHLNCRIDLPRELHAMIVNALAAAPPAAGGDDAELGALIRQMQLGHELWRVDDRADETPGWVLYNNNTETEIYCRGSTPEQALRQALQSAAAADSAGRKEPE